MQQTEKFGCGKFSVVGPIKGQLGRVGYKCLFCNSYRCDGCRVPKLRRLRARIAQISTEHKLQRMATLTLDPSRIPADLRSDKYIRECWRKMRVVLSRRFGKSLPFVAVLEFQRSGVAHFHVLLGVYIPQQWLSEAWQSIGGGRIVDIRYVDVHRVTAYLATYLAGDKVAHTIARLPARARIFSTSRSIALWGKKEITGWWLRRTGLGELYDAVGTRYKERFEPREELQGFGLEMLTYFEGSICQEAIGTRDAIEVLKVLVRYWKQESRRYAFA